MEDEKEAAEHATIVDLIRNDLSQVATDVRVDRYRFIDLLHTNKGDILQTSSEISGKLLAATIAIEQCSIMLTIAMKKSLIPSSVR